MLAHEIAHSEEGHLLARMAYVTGSPVLYLRNLIFSEIYSYSTGEADEYMKRIIKEGQMAMVREILENSTIAQEMQADCYAANWLEKGRRAGWKVSPLDLNRATNKILGVDIGSIENDDEFPPVMRYKAIKSGRYIGSGCHL